jgi:hypothetical protein
MSNIFNILAFTTVLTGLSYFILRLTLFSSFTSFSTEIRKLKAFDYFLTIKNVDSNIPGRTIKCLNWLLRITYVLYACSMIVAISKSIIDEFFK